MKFLIGDDLYRAVLKITRRPGARCAVAFWGRDAETLFAEASPLAVGKTAAGSLKHLDIMVICNLSTGGTNPDVIETLMYAGVKIRQRDDLHAKVYLSDAGAIVSSANASANGLGLEGSEQAFWIEAGVGVDDPSAVSVWFEALWKASRTISPEDLEAARVRRREVTRNKPRLMTFDAFDPNIEPLPLVSWVNSAEIEVARNRIADQLGTADEAACDLVEWGEAVGGQEDETVLLATDWVLRWTITSRGRPSRREIPLWARLNGQTARKVRRLKGERPYHDVILGSEPNRSTLPFDPSEPRFLETFRSIITSSKFRPLRDLEYEGSFFTSERLVLTREFWRDVKAAYLQAAKA